MTHSHHEVHQAAVPSPEHATHGGPGFNDYFRVFIALSILTALSFLAFWVMSGLSAVGMIIALALIKATLVIVVFMHLWTDWRILYGIIIPVLILCVMSVFIFIPDQILPWPKEAPLEPPPVRIAP